jgi:DtxR family Mn-dependent transcriptional regulator
MSGMTQALSASLENYLEAIFLLIQQNTVARSKDIAQRLKVNKSSVTGALQALRERKLVNYRPYGCVTLTNRGTEVAARVLRRHEALRSFFVNVLSIDEHEADEAACRMEHGISKHIVDRLIDFADFVETCPRAGAGWIGSFGNKCDTAPPSPEICENCIADCLDDARKAKQMGELNGMNTTLKDLKPGERGRIERMSGANAIKRRIRDMGVTTGSVVEVIRIAPMGDPIDVKVRGYHLSLRKEEADDILVTKVE